MAYFTFFVPLGEKTLYQHMVGISETSEAKKLGSELEKKAEDVADEVIERVPELKGESRSKGKNKDNAAEKKHTNSIKKGSDQDSEQSKTHKHQLKVKKPLSEPSDNDKKALDNLLRKKNK